MKEQTQRWLSLADEDFDAAQAMLVSQQYRWTMFLAIDIRRIVTRYAHALEKVVRLDKIVLFGSYAHGPANEWSDIDLAVISPDFDGLEMWARIDLMAQARSDRDSRIEALGYGSRQFENADRLTFLGEIKRTGKIAYPTSPPRSNGQRKSSRARMRGQKAN